MSTEILIPLFETKLHVISSLTDRQICEIIRGLSNHFKGKDVEISDDLACSIYNMILADFDRYDVKCKADRERQRAYREKRAQAEAKETPKKEKPEKADKHSADVAEIIGYLNQVMGANYSANAKAATRHINARLDEGYTVDDFKTVIEKMCRLWKGTEMEKYLRPATLFNSEKFEGYLNRPDKTDAEMAQEAAMHKKYDGLFNWAQRKDGTNDAGGIYEDDVDHLGELPDFSKL